MIDVDLYNDDIQYEYRRRQELDAHAPPMCINKTTCASQRHFYAEFPNIVNDADSNATWGSSTGKKERTQQGH